MEVITDKPQIESNEIVTAKEEIVKDENEKKKLEGIIKEAQNEKVYLHPK